MPKLSPTLFVVTAPLFCAALYLWMSSPNTSTVQDVAPVAHSPKKKPTPKALPREKDTPALPSPTGLFQPLPTPEPGHWRAVFRERRQSFDQYVAQRWAKPNARRNTLAILPLGYTQRKPFPDFQIIEDFISAYFGLPVSLMPPDRMSRREFTFRRASSSGTAQVLTRSIHFNLLERYPNDAFGLMAITTFDVYPGPSWNYVFGEVLPEKRLGVVSLVRLDPAFYGQRRNRDTRENVLRRSLKIIGHEIGHIFGLLHCVDFKCNMNGSNSLEELDQQPIHLCPRCLRKLRHSVGFDAEKRYRKLLALYQKASLEEEHRWMQRRLGKLADGANKLQPKIFSGVFGVGLL